ncbi:MAG TPA: PIG-L deacetylase family protein [Patescibacteria group bacterium]|nr:PIG-L deacetylase family protein [Patescibacteria group bacterium]
MTVLGIGAHPDDLDFGASGTFAKWAKEGADCYYLICTDGRKGSDDPKMTEEKLIKIRQDEQREAAKILGLKDVFFLKNNDTQLVADINLKKEIVRVIRKVKPDIVVTLDPTFVYSAKTGFINHTDHRAAGLAAMDAVFPMARDRLTFNELEKEELKPHKVPTIYFISFEEPTEIVDISTTFETKRRALLTHKSQVKEENLGWIEKRAKALGEKKGYKFAEGFIKLTLPI